MGRGRYYSDGGHNFGVEVIGQYGFRLHWTVDYYYANSRLRYPRHFSRDTDEAGAIRFAKKHGVTIPERRQGQ